MEPKIDFLPSPDLFEKFKICISKGVVRGEIVSQANGLYYMAVYRDGGLTVCPPMSIDSNPIFKDGSTMMSFKNDVIEVMNNLVPGKTMMFIVMRSSSEKSRIHGLSIDVADILKSCD